MSAEHMGPSKSVIRRRRGHPTEDPRTPQAIQPEIAAAKIRVLGEVLGAPMRLTGDVAPGETPPSVLRNDLLHHVGNKNVTEVALLIPQIDGLLPQHSREPKK